MNYYKTIKIAVAIFSISLLWSCDVDGYEDYDNGGTKVKALSGEWYVVGYSPDGEPAFGGDYNLWSTYNTAANNNQMWLDDHGSFFEVKTKVEADVSELTFSGETNAPELITGGTVTVNNGKIIPDGARAYGSRNVVDSIYFEIEFDWDPGVIYSFGGHRRTGFREDEDPSL